MTSTDIITALISLLAVTVSLVALQRSRQNHAQLLELEKVHAELSRRQIDEIDERKQEALKAKLAVRLEKGDKGYKFIITNQGQSTASNIYFGIEQGNEHNPLVRGDFEQKIPFPALAPNGSYYLLAHIPLSIRQLTYEISIRWNNPDGTQEREIQSVAR